MNFIRSAVKHLLGTKLFNNRLKNKIFIFCYHDISDESDLWHSAYYSTTIASFEQQIKFIKENFRIISISDLRAFKSLPKNKAYAIITFDDGFQSVLQNAYPILKPENIPFTVFINKSAVLKNRIWFSDLVLNRDNMSYLSNFYDVYFSRKNENIKKEFLSGNLMLAVENVNYEMLLNDTSDGDAHIYLNLKTWKEWSQSEPLLTLGNHTSNHFNLGKCSLERAIEEITSNHEFIDSFTKQENLYFAFPFGKIKHYTKDLVNWLVERKIKVFTTNPTYIDLNVSELPNLLPRIPIAKQTLQEIIFLINRTTFKKIDL